MICFQDRSWCSSSNACANVACDRHFSDDDRAEAVVFVPWWGSDAAPVAFMDHRKTCGKFQPINDAAATWAVLMDEDDTNG